MPSRVHRFQDTRNSLNDKSEYASGAPGESPVVLYEMPWPMERRLKIGDVVKCHNKFNDIEYVYVVKEQGSNWWKLEWPD